MGELRQSVHVATSLRIGIDSETEQPAHSSLGEITLALFARQIDAFKSTPNLWLKPLQRGGGHAIRCAIKRRARRYNHRRSHAALLAGPQHITSCHGGDPFRQSAQRVQSIRSIQLSSYANMAPQCLTVLAPIRRGQQDRLRDVLRAIGNDIAGKHLADNPAQPYIDFPGSRSIHFARFAILSDPDRGPGRVRLLFASVYDGTLDAHLQELVTITSDMDAIWASCERYSGVAGFPAFMRANMYEPDAFYIAFRDETAASIKRAIATRRRLQDNQDSERTAAAMEDKWQASAMNTVESGQRATNGNAGAIAWLVRAAPIVVDLVRAVARFGIRIVYFSTRRITASLDRYVIFRLFNCITGNSIPPMQSHYSSVALDDRGAAVPLESGDEIPLDAAAPAPEFREDAVAQNQLTVVTVVDPGGVNRVRAVLAAIDSYSKRLSPTGSLIGISTIHFVRWLLIDEGRRLVLISDYDGSWESYIDEFAEMILSGLDAIWETSYGRPPDGARDIPAFKRFLRSHQVPAEIFFAAYPDETVLNIAADRFAVPANGIGPDAVPAR